MTLGPDQERSPHQLEAKVSIWLLNSILVPLVFLIFFLKIDLKLTVKLQNDKVWISSWSFVLINQQTIKLLILKDQLCDGNIVIKFFIPNTFY